MSLRIVIFIVLATFLSLAFGLGFRPRPPESNGERTLIWYRRTEKDANWEYWTNELRDLLQVYQAPGTAAAVGNTIQCDFDHTPPAGKVCVVNIDQFHPCTNATQFNYPRGSPCVFLTFDKILNWQPDFYNTSENLPSNMPFDVIDTITSLRNRSSANTVWVSCEGENPADVENMGPIMYMPRRGFPGYYFPFHNIEGYQSPLVAVLFERPAIGVLINIECKAWAKNINHDRHETRGSVHFQLLID